MRKILAAKPSITQLEIDYVTDAVTHGWGENCYDYIIKFKEKLKSYFSSKNVWPTSSCHGAIHLALMSLNIGPGDEVIVPDATWVGSVSPIVWLGAKPIFVDVLQETWCISPEKINNAITSKTKAIIAVHLYGNLCEMDEIMAIGKKYNIPIIEDAAEAIGSEYKGKKAGAIADFGVFSFHGTKTLTTGEGGALISNRPELTEKINTIESQGRKPGAKYFWVDEIGLKYKMSNIQAALGLAQFERVEELVNQKRQIFSWYKKALIDIPDTTINYEQEYTKNSYWMPTLIFGDSWEVNCKSLIDNFNNEGIALRPFFYPVSSFPKFETTTSPIAERCHNKGINLPSYFELSEDDIHLICSRLKAALRND